MSASRPSSEEVVEHDGKGGIKHPWHADRRKPLNLSEPEKRGLVASLKAPSGEGWQHLQPPKAGELPR